MFSHPGGISGANRVRAALMSHATAAQAGVPGGGDPWGDPLLVPERRGAGGTPGQEN